MLIISGYKRPKINLDTSLIRSKKNHFILFADQNGCIILRRNVITSVQSICIFLTILIVIDSYFHIIVASYLWKKKVANRIINMKKMFFLYFIITICLYSSSYVKAKHLFEPDNLWNSKYLSAESWTLSKVALISF